MFVESECYLYGTHHRVKRLRRIFASAPPTSTTRRGFWAKSYPYLPVLRAVMKEMHLHFRPEFLNRVDDVVLFKPLRLDEIKRIADLLAEQLRARLADRRITLDIADPAKEFIAREGYDPVYGARPLKRLLQRELETRIGRALIAGDILDGATVHVELDNDRLAIRPQNPAPA